MWRLPRLEWQASIWRLPLCPAVASQLAQALLEERTECLRLLARLLQTDPPLLLWVLCQAPHWRTAPPPDPNGPAEWLLDSSILAGLDLEPDATPDSTYRGSVALDTSAPTTTPEYNAANWAKKLLPDAFAWLRKNGASADAVLLQDCPWFPAWLVPQQSSSPEQDSGSASSSHDSESLAKLLPRVIQLVRRANQLENQFTVTLEREKLAALRELAYGASHEINNPLANIATRAQALLREESDPERKRKLSTIAAQALRAHEMISDMMLFAKPPAPVRQRTDLSGIVRDVIREMLPEARSQDTQLQSEVIPDSLSVSADPTQLGVAVKALLRNALEALATGGTVVVTVRKLEADSAGKSWVEIVVADSGPGITPEVRRHLFDPFYSGREAGRGLGFGLAKCWRIAELHGGDIRVESEPGQGATFTLRVPYPS